jgi:hypothetical protein
VNGSGIVIGWSMNVINAIDEINEFRYFPINLG